MGRPKKNYGDDAVRMLRLLRDIAPGPRSASVISTARIAEEMGCSTAKVKILRRVMTDEGLIEARERVADNGAQMENAYRITRKGRRVLANADEGGAPMSMAQA